MALLAPQVVRGSAVDWLKVAVRFNLVSEEADEQNRTLLLRIAVRRGAC
jgi:hypothetical protein